MALGITITPLRPTQSLFKGRKVKLVKFTGDNAMPSGGYVVTAAKLDLRVIEALNFGPDNNGLTLWTFATASTNSSLSTNQATLLPYTALGASATASATGVSKATVFAFVYGY